MFKKKSYKIVRFSKEEINSIMEINSQKISIGEWKDYSICFHRNFALFCIHKSYWVSPEFEILKSFTAFEETIINACSLISFLYLK